MYGYCAVWIYLRKQCYLLELFPDEIEQVVIVAGTIITGSNTIISVILLLNDVLVSSSTFHYPKFHTPEHDLHRAPVVMSADVSDVSCTPATYKL